MEIVGLSSQICVVFTVNKTIDTSSMINQYFSWIKQRNISFFFYRNTIFFSLLITRSILTVLMKVAVHLGNRIRLRFLPIDHSGKKKKIAWPYILTNCL